MPELFTIYDYMRANANLLGERILQEYPALHQFDAAVSPCIGALLRRPFPAQTIAIMGVVKRWQRARTAMVVAECGTGKTLISLGAIHVHSKGHPSTALTMVPPHLVEKWAREAFLTVPGIRVFLIDDLRNGGDENRPHGVNFYAPLARQAALLKDDLLDPVDQLLDDPILVDLVRRCLATRSPLSQRTGRTGMAPDRLLRCCVMKHLKGWSFRDLERELRSNLVYRRFTHFDAEATPDFSTFSRTFALLSPAMTEQIHQRVVGLACEQGVASGRKLRTDTTVVESNVHYPTDSSLLGDGIRVLTRSLQRIARDCKHGAVEVVHHARAVKHRLLEISRAAKCLTEANQQRMRDSYQKLLALTRGVVRQASDVMQRWRNKRLKVVGKWLRVETQIGQLRHFLPLVEKVIRQTKKRVLGGDSNVEGKVLSLFEAHTDRSQRESA